MPHVLSGKHEGQALLDVRNIGRTHLNALQRILWREGHPLRFAPAGIECDLHHLPVLAIRLAVIVDRLYAHVTLISVVVQSTAEFAFLGRELLDDLGRRRGGSAGVDGAKALVGLIRRRFALGQQRHRRNRHKR